jgi:predicted HicB family RNase H-like nuclease
MKMTMTKNKLAHKGFTGSFEVSLEDGCLIGRVLFIDDIITYEGETVAELTVNFEAAVDRYLAYCKKTGKPANKPYSGTFNVRVGPELHRAAAIAANDASINLNEFVAHAIKTAVKKEMASTVVHNHIITFKQESAPVPVWTGMATSQEMEKYSATTTHH